MRVIVATWGPDLDAEPVPLASIRVDNMAEAKAALYKVIENKQERWLTASFGELSLWVCSVDQWWWVAQNLQELDVFFNAEQPPVDVDGHYEMVEGIWGGYMLLPWWGASDSEWAKETVRQITTGARPDTVRSYLQSPEVVEPRHQLEDSYDYFEQWLNFNQELPACPRFDAG